MRLCMYSSPSTCIYIGLIRALELKLYFLVNFRKIQMCLLMDWELKGTVIKDDVGGFTQILERVSRDSVLSQQEVLEHRYSSRNTLLHLAARCGNDGMVELIARHAPQLLMATNSEHDLPLHVAAKAGRSSTLHLLVRLLVNYPSNLEPSSEETRWELKRFGPLTPAWIMRKVNHVGNTCLHEALINGHFDLALDLLSKYPYPGLPYIANRSSKSPLYLAILARNETFVNQVMDGQMNSARTKLEGRPPLHAAIERYNIDIPDTILKDMPEWVSLRDEKGWTPLHYAAYKDGLRSALSSAGRNWGHGLTIQELLDGGPDLTEMRDDSDRNILHVAAQNGKLNVVKFILRAPELKMLLNERDEKGKTPLHLAATNCHSKIVSALTWDKRVDIKLEDDENRTALDSVEHKLGFQVFTSLKQRLTWIALKAAGTHRGSGQAPPATRKFSMAWDGKVDNYEGRVNTLLLVATLVATVTFAAGFTIPGGLIDSGLHEGTATMVKRPWFHVFVFCNSIAMHGAIIVAVSLIWAQLGDFRLVILALRLALPLLGVSLATMSLAFSAGVYLHVSTLNWLATAFLSMDLIFLAVLVTLYMLFWFPTFSRLLLLRYLSYYPFLLLASIAEMETDVRSFTQLQSADGAVIFD